MRGRMHAVWRVLQHSRHHTCPWWRRKVRRSRQRVVALRLTSKQPHFDPHAAFDLSQPHTWSGSAPPSSTDLAKLALDTGQGFPRTFSTLFPRSVCHHCRCPSCWKHQLMGLAELQELIKPTRELVPDFSFMFEPHISNPIDRMLQ